VRQITHAEHLFSCNFDEKVHQKHMLFIFACSICTYSIVSILLRLATKYAALPMLSRFFAKWHIIKKKYAREEYV